MEHEPATDPHSGTGPAPDPDLAAADDHPGPTAPSDRTGQSYKLAPPRHPVAPAAKRWWATRAMLGWALAAFYTIVLPALLSLALSLSLWWPIGCALITIALATAHVLIMPRLRYDTHRWEVTDTAVYTLAGWIKWQWRIAPLERIETVEVSSGPLQHRFGLASVYVSTASSAGRVAIAGLELDRARRLSDELTAKTRELRGATP